jgi:glycine/D-amino acid oxidase-like deaminating enzyme
MTSPDVVVIGGGVAGCSVAALLAEAGARVRLYEREAVAAGASGRNSGLLQHPMDEALLPLYETSMELYAGLGHGFAHPAEPVGVLVLSPDEAALAADRDQVAARFPELAPEWLEGAALAEAEPGLAPELFAYRLTTGLPVPPTAATRAWAERARAAGARIVVGEAATLARGDRRVEGVRVGGRLEPADAVVVAAGPWTPEALGADPAWRPVGPMWGVVAQVRLPDPPRHALEHADVEGITSPGGSPDVMFTLIPAGGTSTLGSTFALAEPDPHSVAPRLIAHGTHYVPGLRAAAIESVRACARPLSADGRPLLGAVPGVDCLHVLTGHGPWGVTLGPGSARLVADGVLGRPAAIPPELRADRFGTPFASAAR